MSIDAKTDQEAGTSPVIDAKLRASELSYRRLFEAARDGILILDVDSGRITDVNPFLVELLGFSHDKMVGKTVGELSPFQDVACNQAMLERLQADKYVRYEDLPLRTKDGRQIAVEFVSNIYAAGDKEVIQCNIRDITERKKREARLTLLDTCVENLNDAVLVTEASSIDEPGPRIVFVNKAFERISGYTSSEAMGRSPRFLQGAKTDQRTLDEIRKALVDQQPIRRQIINYNKDGTEYWMDVDIVPIFDPAGKCTHFAAIERDITESKNTEESLKLFRTLIDRSADAIEVIDPETGRFLDVNEVAYTRLGYSREEMLSLGVFDIIDVADTSSVRAGMAEMRETGIRIVESRHKRKDGTTFPVEIHIQYIHLNRGYLIAIVRDITERKQAEQERQATEARYRTLFDHAPDGIVIADPQSFYIDANASMCRMLGYTRDEFIGLHASDIVTPSEAAYVGPAISAIQARTDYHREWQFKRKDGTVFAAEVIATSMPDGNLLGLIRDITDRKRASEQIAEQAALLDKAQDAILVRDLTGIILFWNKGAERMYGWQKEEVLGKNIAEFLYADPKKFIEVNGLTILQGEWHGELQHLTKTRGEITIEARWTLIRDDDGQPKSVLSINTDITERKQIEAQFMRAQRMESIGTLAGGIAHDLNNILAPIMMSIDILKTISENPQAKTILETIEVSARRGADIVRQVLSFARGLEGERTELQPRHLLNDLEKIIKDTFPKNIELTFSVPSDTWTILGDPTQVHQILLNLCVNGRDAMPNGGNLTISVQNAVLDDHYAAMNIQAKAGRFVKITVTDSGTGMPPGVLDKIFEPFFTTKELSKGTGLGLSTVMAIVKSHGGHINVYSEPGKGTAFNIYLPAMEISSEARKELAEEASLPRGNGETILVIDDETSILTITSQTLQAFGYRVLTAMDGADGLAVYAQNKKEIAVVISDMMMPIMDGPATIRALMRISPSVKIIAASGLNANINATKAAGAGVKHFLTKPYTARTLLKLLRAILDETP